MDGNAVPKRLKEARMQAGWSLDELAAKTGLNRNTLHRAETGKTAMHGSSLRRVAMALRLPLEYFTQPPSAANWACEKRAAKVVNVTPRGKPVPTSLMSHPDPGLECYALVITDPIPGVANTGDTVICESADRAEVVDGSWVITWAPGASGPQAGQLYKTRDLQNSEGAPLDYVLVRPGMRPLFLDVASIQSMAYISEIRHKPNSQPIGIGRLFKSGRPTRSSRTRPGRDELSGLSSWM